MAARGHRTTQKPGALRRAWGAALLLCLLNPVASSAGEDTAFVDALRQRGLQRLAEVHCRRQLLDATPGDRRHATLVGLLSQIEVDRALTATPGQRGAHWRAADRVLA
ncbi:MAG: hypothetical protein AAF790_14500, partial [Planctomycetota bacterium]